MIKNQKIYKTLISDENMAKDKAIGLGGLITSIKHHCGTSKVRLTFMGSQDPVGDLEYRGRMLETDLGTLGGAVAEILDIAKRNGYEDIRQIIEEREYEHGHEFP